MLKELSHVCQFTNGARLQVTACVGLEALVNLDNLVFLQMRATKKDLEKYRMCSTTALMILHIQQAFNMVFVNVCKKRPDLFALYDLFVANNLHWLTAMKYRRFTTVIITCVGLFSYGFRK